jgi:hypothetical protein
MQICLVDDKAQSMLVAQAQDAVRSMSIIRMRGGGLPSVGEEARAIVNRDFRSCKCSE